MKYPSPIKVWALAVLGAIGPAAAQSSSPRVDWPFYGNDPGGMRYASTDQINASNVSQLKPAWILHTGIVDEHTSLETQPIIVDGVMYVTSPHDHVFAIDAATGALKWTYTPKMPALEDLALCCGQNNRGVAVGGGKVFIAQLDATLVALDATNGKTVWQTPVADWHDKASETMAPLYVDGEVIVGISGGEFELRGFVDAYDAQTGKRLWRFNTVPGPGERGHDTWAGDSWKHGGATVWTTPVVDPEIGLLYVTTGNAGPDMNGSQRGGDNLFSDSIVALDVKTGQYRWHFQEVHHDLWDYDAAQPPHLFTLERNGERIPAIGHANKNGYYFILDRRTGKPVFDVKETPVPTEPAWQHPSPTQPVSTIPALIPHQVETVPDGFHAAPMWTPPQDKQLLIQPGWEAGPEWTASAYSPRTKYAYIAAGGYQPWVYHANPAEENVVGSTMLPKVPGIENCGLLDAVDTTTGKIAWQFRSPHKLVSGVAVAGDLVLFGESDGRFDALDARTGQQLWSFRSDQKGVGGANGSPAVYTVDGREFVAMAFGGNDHVRLSDASPTGDAIIAFAVSTGEGTPHVVNADPPPVPTGAIPPSAMVQPQDQPSRGAKIVTLETHDYRFHPNQFEVSPGEKIAVHLVNNGLPPSGIAFMFPSGPVALKGPVKPKEDVYLAFTAPDHAGVYKFFSPLPGQKAFGMIGKMSVEAK